MFLLVLECDIWLCDNPMSQYGFLPTLREIFPLNGLVVQISPINNLFFQRIDALSSVVGVLSQFHARFMSLGLYYRFWMCCYPPTKRRRGKCVADIVDLEECTVHSEIRWASLY